MICPVCDTMLDKDCNNCPTCGLTRSLIEAEMEEEGEIAPDVGEVVANIDQSMIEEDEEDIFDFVKKFRKPVWEDEEGHQLTEEDVQATEEEIRSVEEISDEIVVFECPLCAAEVGEDETECPNCGAIFEEEDLEVRWEEEFEKVKVGLAEIRNSPISSKALKKMVRDAVNSKKNGDLDTAVDTVIEANEIYGQLEEYLLMLDRSKKNLKKMKDLGMDYHDYVERLKQSKNMVDSGRVEDGLELSSSILADLSKRI